MKLDMHMVLLGAVGIVAIVVMAAMMPMGKDGNVINGVSVGQAIYFQNSVKDPGFENDGANDYFPNTASDDAVAGNSFPNGWWYWQAYERGVRRYCTPGSPPCGNEGPNNYHHGGCCSVEVPKVSNDKHYVLEELDMSQHVGAHVKVSGWVRVNAACIADPSCYGAIIIEEKYGDQTLWTTDINRLQGISHSHQVRSSDWQFVEFEGDLMTNYIDLEGHTHYTDRVNVICYNSPDSDGARGKVYCDDMNLQIMTSGQGASPFNVKSPLPVTRAPGIE